MPALESGNKPLLVPRNNEPTFAPDTALPALEELVQLLTSGGAGVQLQAAGRRAVAVPAAVIPLLQQLLGTLARGDGAVVVPVGRQLTSQQAADLLNISRQYLLQLLEGGALPYTRTGTHRRLQLEDVLAYKQRRDSERGRALDELAQMTQEDGGYPELE